MKSRRPYLLRAMHEWISESNCTPHIVVDAGVAGVEVPRQYVRDGKIVLNISWSATGQLTLGNEEISFSGRFGGSPMTVRIPLEALLAIYARETGQGMIFTDDEGSPPPAAEAGPEAAPAAGPGSGSEPAPKGKGKGRATLKVVK
ncbi:MAG: ClpXP protease specificity-enhancing factor [Steroidobacteraceae bacterium]